MIGETKVRDQLREPVAEPIGAPKRRGAEAPYWRPSALRRVSWGAIIGGTVAAFTIQLMLTTLGIGIGMAAIEPAAGDLPGQGFGIAAGIWWIVTGLISLFVGGMVAGRLAGIPVMVDALLHGMLVWALLGVLGVWLLTTTVANVMGGVFGPLASGMSSAAAQTAAQPGVVERLMNEGQQRMGAANSEIPRTQQQQRTADPGAARSNAPAAGYDPFSEDATTRQPRTEAGSQIQQALPTEQDVREAADTAADAMAQASLWSFFALLLGAGAAALGGYYGRPPMEHEEGPAVRKYDEGPAVRKY